MILRVYLWHKNGNNEYVYIEGKQQGKAYLIGIVRNKDNVSVVITERDENDITPIRIKHYRLIKRLPHITEFSVPLPDNVREAYIKLARQYLEKFVSKHTQKVIN